MHHLDEVSGARRSYAPPSLILGRSQRLEDWCEPFNRLFVAANHQAVSLFQTPHAARCAAVHKMKTLVRQLGVAALRVLVVGVASIDEGVSLLHQGLEP